ncbi:MAG: DUF3891 family protein [Reinekea sp.]|nr:DUF3891 family protein [Reinekea sp.]
MFKSEARPINIPQYEHGRLAGIFALLWGNENFDKPAIDFASFVQGVALHDWHYGPVDNLPIREASEGEWLTMVRKGVEQWFANPTTDIVTKLHLKRLLSGRESPEISELVSQLELRLAERLPQTSFTREHFEWADRITAFCDDLAFDFSFEKPVEETLLLPTKIHSSEETPITYIIRPNGEIWVVPWPFSQPSFSGIIVGYERPGYPEKLKPKVIPYHCQLRNLS